MELEICDWCGIDDDTVEYRAEAGASICDDCLTDLAQNIVEIIVEQRKAMKANVDIDEL